MPISSRPSEVCYLLTALHLPFKILALCITATSSSMGTQIRFVREDISLLAQNSFQFHIIPLRLHIDWNSLHFQGQLHFYVLCMYDKAKACACVCEMCNDAGWRQTGTMTNNSQILLCFKVFSEHRRRLWVTVQWSLAWHCFPPWCYNSELL